jgi:hypothetical protein
MAAVPHDPAVHIPLGRPVRLLVIDGYSTFDWPALFAGQTLKDGTPIGTTQSVPRLSSMQNTNSYRHCVNRPVVDSCSWGDISVSASTHSKVAATLMLRPNARTGQPGRAFHADFVLARLRLLHRHHHFLLCIYLFCILIYLSYKYRYF